MASLSSFEEIMEFRLAELRSQLAAEHQLALQQAVGYHSKQLALENSLLRSEVEALRQRVVGGPAVDPFAGKNRPLRSERVPGSPIVFAELLQELYAEEEPLEQLSDLLEDKMLFCLYCAQRNCQEVFRVPFGRRKAKRAPGGHAVARTASSSSLVSNRSSEAKWIAIAEPGSRRSLGQPPDASPLGRSCSAPAAGSRLSTASELDELEAFPLEISPTSQEPLSTSSSRVAALAGVLEEPRSPARGLAPAVKEEAPSSSPKEALGSDEGTPAAEVERPAEAQQGPVATEPGSELAQPDRSRAQEALQAEACPSSPQVDERQTSKPEVVVAESGSENAALAEAELKSSAPTVAPETAPDTGPAEPAKEADATVTVAAEHAPAPEPAPEPAPPTPEPAPRTVEEPAPEVVEEVPRKVPALADVLRWAKPSWTPKERAGAQAKLGKVGVQTSEDLLRSLVRAQLADKLNERLREAGLTVFSSATLQALTQTLHEKLPPHVLGIDTTAQDDVQANGDESLMGFWVGKDHSASYEIRSMRDGGFPGGMSIPDGLQGRGLWYCRRLAQGEVQAGPLQSREGAWPWEVPLQDGSRLRFQLQKSGVMVCERQLEESAAWKPHGSAERPQAYAWFNTMEHKEGHRYIHLPEAEGSSDFPMIGLTAGWVPASLPTGSVNSNRNALNETTMRLQGTFCDPFDASLQQTLLSQVHELASVVPSATTMQRSYRRQERQQHQLEPSQCVARYYNIPVQQLRERAKFRGKTRAISNEKSFQDMSWKLSTNSVQVGTSFPPPQPTLSIICVRWYNYWSDAKNSSDYNVLNDGFFTDLLSGPNSPLKVLQGQVEIYTVFIRNTSDLLKLRPAQLRTMLKGKNVTCWYFLWPNCEGLPGEVAEREFFRLCQNMERLPIRSGWPHQSHLYRILCGKHWMPQMSLNKEFRVPPTTRVNYAHFKDNPQKTSERALAHLVMLKRKVWGEDVDPEEFKGVVKMGYSWGGCDVLPFKGTSSLQKNLSKLFSHKSCQKESCLVQECVSNVIGEVRYIVMQDQFRGSTRTAFSWMQNGIGESFAKHNIRQPDVPEFVMATHFVIDQTEVHKKVFGGSRQSQKSVENTAQSTVDCWMRWFQTESQFPPQTTRIDFIVSRTEKGFEVWTCEVGENGASLCNVEVHGRNLAALNRAVIREDNKRFPLQFSDKITRNNGEKG